MIKLTHATLAAATLLVSPALAQTTQPAAPAPQTPAAAPAPVSDAEVVQFAKAALAVDAVNKDATIPATDKPARLAAAVTGMGLAPERFNEIAGAAQADPALQQKVQAAIAAEQAPAPAQ